MTVIGSFDIGVKNLSFCVARVVNGHQINILKWVVLDISEKGDLRHMTYARLCELCIKYLDMYSSYFDMCDEIILEKQLSKNQKMKNMSFCIFTYFIMRYYIQRKIDKINFIDAKYKLKIPYDGPTVICRIKDRSKRAKFFSKAYCEYYLRNNSYLLSEFQNSTKRDDLADCFLQFLWYCDRYKKRLAWIQLEIKQEMRPLVRLR